MDETTWFKLLLEQGPLIASLAAFILAAFTGQVRFAREFKQLEEINIRLAEIVRENSKMIGEAIAANKELLNAMKQAIELLEASREQSDQERERRRR